MVTGSLGLLAPLRVPPRWFALSGHNCFGAVLYPVRILVARCAVFVVADGRRGFGRGPLLRLPLWPVLLWKS